MMIGLPCTKGWFHWPLTHGDVPLPCFMGKETEGQRHELPEGIWARRPWRVRNWHPCRGWKPLFSILQQPIYWFFLLSLLYLVCSSIKSQDSQVCLYVCRSVFVFMCVHGYVCAYMSVGLCKCVYVRICVPMCLWVITCVLYKIGLCDMRSPGLTML